MSVNYSSKRKIRERSKTVIRQNSFLDKVTSRMRWLNAHGSDPGVWIPKTYLFRFFEKIHKNIFQDNYANRERNE